MSKIAPGETILAYFPWIKGIRQGRIIEKRIPKKGEYALATLKGPIVLFKSDGSIPKWVVELV